MEVKAMLVWCCAVLLAVGCAVVVQAQADVTAVNVEQGVLRGLVDEDTRVYLSVPYAQPPIGSLRWRSPQSPAPFPSGSYNATVKRDDCVQAGRRFRMSEDCLYLSLYAPLPSEAGFGKWPVMFFIHGGSFGGGGIGLIPLYNGLGIIEETRGHVLVFVNYRLSALGFLGSDELAAESEDGSTGNFGLQDQRQALIWIQRNVAAFGGDPNNVMIFGESAGSWSVQDHLLLKKSHGLFHSAIMESGVHNEMFVMNRTQYNEQWGKFSSQAGCDRDPECMRRLSWQELVERTDEWTKFGGWGLRIDGVEISESPKFLLQRGEFARVPVIIGSNLDEIPADFNMRKWTPEQYYAWLQETFAPKYGPEFAGKVAALYTIGEGGKYETPWFAIQAILTHETFTCAGIRSSRWMSNFTTVHHYEFQQPVGLVNLLLPAAGVFHASELVFTLRFRPLIITFADRRVSRSVTKYWTSFASNRNPNSAGEVNWEPYQATSGRSLLIKDGFEVTSFIYQDACALWDTVSDVPPRDSFTELLSPEMAEQVEKIFGQV